MDKLEEILKQNPELALALAMVLQTEAEDVLKSYLDVVPQAGVLGTYDHHAIFRTQYRKLIEALKIIAVEGIAKRKKK